MKIINIDTFNVFGDVEEWWETDVIKIRKFNAFQVHLILELKTRRMGKGKIGT